MYTYNNSQRFSYPYIFVTEKNFSKVSPDEFRTMLKRVNLKDSDQFQAALSILDKMTENHEAPTNPPDTTSSSSSSTSAADTSPSRKYTKPLDHDAPKIISIDKM